MPRRDQPRVQELPRRAQRSHDAVSEFKTMPVIAGPGVASCRDYECRRAARRYNARSTASRLAQSVRNELRRRRRRWSGSSSRRVFGTPRRDTDIVWGRAEALGNAAIEGCQATEAPAECVVDQRPLGAREQRRTTYACLTPSSASAADQAATIVPSAAQGEPRPGRPSSGPRPAGSAGTGSPRGCWARRPAA
jgi:hypothetical protein